VLRYSFIINLVWSNYTPTCYCYTKLATK